MRRLALPALAAVALLAVGLIGVVGTADARAKRTCKLKGAKTFKKNREVRLLRRAETHDTIDVKRHYGCHVRTRKRVVLADTGGYDGGGISVKLRGRFVAVNYRAQDRADNRFGFLRLWDLRRPKRLISIKDVEATDIEIGRKGELAWIGNPLANIGEADPPVSVRVGRRVLATGNIVPTSLKIRGSTVYWTQDGSERSAPL